MLVGKSVVTVENVVVYLCRDVKQFYFKYLEGNNTLYSLQPENTSGTIKEQLAAVAPALERLLQQKEERVKEFSEVQLQIQKICGEITGNLQQVGTPAVDETDLSLKKLDEYQVQLKELQKEKVYEFDEQCLIIEH